VVPSPGAAGVAGARIDEQEARETISVEHGPPEEKLSAQPQSTRRIGWGRPDRRRRRPTADTLLDGPGFTALRVAVDFTMLLLAVGGAIIGARAAGVPPESEPYLYAFPPLVMLLLHTRGMYRRRLRISILDGIAPVVGAISVAAMIVLATVSIVDFGALTTPLIARAWLFGVMYVGAGRVVLALAQRRARARGTLGRPVLIVGAGAVGAHVARRLEEAPEYGLRPIGFLDADPPPSIEVVDRRAPILGGPDQLVEVAAQTGARHVILAFTRSPDLGLIPLIRRCEELGLEVSVVPRLFDSMNERVALDHLGGLPLLELRAIDPEGWMFAVKHLLDRAGAALVLLGLAPLLLAVAAGVKLTSPGPILFRQRRVGRDGTVFDLLKFRSMRSVEDGDGRFLPRAGAAPGGVEGEDRRTGLGRWLRRTSVDELPQLLNVLGGEMSLIGPRPERPEFVELFGQDVDRYTDRHRVKSGITGWAQVHGLRGQTSLADRVEWDNYYIENWSPWLDAKILLLTVMAIFRKPPES